MSLDGFIADADGGVSWIEGDGSDPNANESYSAFYDSIDTVIIGNTTYNQIITELSPNKWVYGDKTSYILTHHPKENLKNILFTDEDVLSLTQRLKAEQGQDIWVCGGAKVANLFVSQNLIDRFYITVVPIILGRGVRLFSDQNPKIIYIVKNPTILCEPN
jgi:dihydrofolate reductase